MGLLWCLLAAGALWWPGHLSGPLHGAPLDTAADALLLGLLVPTLCWFARWFLHDRRARALIVGLIAWKAFTNIALVHDGWCVAVIPTQPYVDNETGLPHSWDVRAEWRDPNPTCTAIMTRGYDDITEFPVWFFNLPRPLHQLPRPIDVPPDATTGLRVHGALIAQRDGVFRVDASPDVAIRAAIDGRPLTDGAAGERVAAGAHTVTIDGTLTGNHWRLRPLWNGRDLWHEVMATIVPPSNLDRAMRPWASAVTTLLAAALVAAWTFAFARRAADRWMLAWTLFASAALALFVLYQPEPRWHYGVAALIAASMVRVPPRLRNLVGAFVLVGVPWLTIVAALNADEFGRMRFYTAGNDWWEFQRFAYRIYLQGYWLEGGEQTFWFQPFYRWIAGALHMLLGDSSIGEEYWDGACLLAGALFAFHVVKVFASFRWGVIAAALSLAVFMAGPGFIFVGHGLSEISSAGFLYLAALFALRSRRGSLRYALLAGLCATLAVWTRLNNVPMAIAVAMFAWPIHEPVRTLRTPRRWLTHASAKTIVTIAAVLLAGFVLFGLRTWYYTGQFSVILGTALDATRGSARRVWQPGMPPLEAARAMADSVMMVLTTTDPPAIHTGSLPIIAGVAIAFAALAGIGVLGELPLAVVIFCLAAPAGALLARGTAYPGRFSIHVIPAATAVLICAMSRVVSRLPRAHPRATPRRHRAAAHKQP